MMRWSLLVLLFCCQPVWCQEASPGQVARRLYDWALKADYQTQKKLPEVRDCFTPELYTQLSRAYAKNPDDGEFLDFDPFSNSQMGADGYDLGTAVVEGSRARVPVKVRISRGGETSYSCHLQRQNGRWRVSNFVYSKEFNLMSALKAINGGGK